MTDCREVTSCRVCGGPLEAVLDLGTQALAGRFPLASEPDPPAFPLVLCRCASGCGLVQLGHTVEPELMFREYHYRSSVSGTMREHLDQLAVEAVSVLGRAPQNVLDIGCNDGFLLSCVASRTGARCVGVDPCDVPLCETAEGPLQEVLIGLWPGAASRLASNYDLVFTVACFYDADDPVAFARAVRDKLADNSLWVVEVASLWSMLSMWGLGYDSIVHEHIAYYQPGSLEAVLWRAGFEVVRTTFTPMNGGSFRLFARKAPPREAPPVHGLGPDGTAHLLHDFAVAVKAHRERFRERLCTWRDLGMEVHLLGASTKMNTVLQYAGVTTEFIQAAADRDPRKVGRVCPGTRIPILSEEASRELEPDVYLTVLGHFKKEVLAREQQHLLRGGRVVFVLPNLEEVKG